VADEDRHDATDGTGDGPEWIADEVDDEEDADGDDADGDGSDAGHTSRRRLLRTGVTLGAGAALVFGVGADYATSDDLGTITYAMARRPPDGDTLVARTREVPAAWHQQLRMAFEAQSRIREAGLSPLVGSFVVPGTYDRPEASLSVDATDENVADSLGELVEDVAIDLNVVDEFSPQAETDSDPSEAYQLPDPVPDEVPGGVVCRGSRRFGTLTPALFDAQAGDRYFATSNHLYGAAGARETEHRGEPLVIPHADGASHVGDVARGYPTADVVRVEPVDGYTPIAAIDRTSASRVVGQFTRSGLADLMAREKELAKVGALSDRTTGPIKGVDGVTCYTGTACKPGQLKWGDEGTLTNGDSGSVNFRPDPRHPDDSLLVGGINNARTWWPGADYAWGTAGHRLLDAFGLHF